MTAFEGARDAIVSTAFGLSALGTPTAAIADHYASTAETRDALTSVIENAHDSVEAWNEGSRQQDEVVDQIENPVTEPDFVEERHGEASDQWNDASTDVAVPASEWTESDDWSEPTEPDSGDSGDATNG